MDLFSDILAFLLTASFVFIVRLSLHCAIYVAANVKGSSFLGFTTMADWKLASNRCFADRFDRVNAQSDSERAREQERRRATPNFLLLLVCVVLVGSFF